MLKSACALFLLVIFCPTNPVLADQPLSDILEGIRKTYGQLPGLSVPYKSEVITQSMAMLGGGKDVDLLTGQIHVKPPDFVKIQQETPEPQTVFADGHTLWIHMPKKNQAYRSPDIGKDIGRILSDIFQGLKTAEKGFDLSLLGVDEKGICGIRLTPSPPWPEIQHIELAVSQDDYTIHRLEIHNLYGNITRYILGEFQVKEAFPKDFFHFTPPEGVEIIE